MTLDTWERRTDWPLAGLALVFLGCYAWPILDPGLASPVRTALGVGGIAIWALFAIDYAARVYLAEHRGRYVRRHVPDLALLILPMLRPLRALRVLLAFTKVNRRAATSFRGQAAIYVAGAAATGVFVAALAMLDAERGHPGAAIDTFGDALWWACTTVTTVGYGDEFPVTAEGRLIAVGLMLAGIALLGVVTAALASWFVERIGRVEEAEQQTQRDLDVILAELRDLRAAVEVLREPAGPDTRPT